MNRRRVLVVALLSALIPVSACEVRPASAAFVGDTRISQRTVDQLFDRAAKDPVSRDLVAEFPGQSRLAIVQSLVRIAVLRRVADVEGLQVSEAEIDAVRRSAAEHRDELEAPDKVIPLDRFAVSQVYLRALLQRASVGATSEDETYQRAREMVVRTVEKYPVEVNPRYGSFDPARLGLVPAKEAAVRPLPPTGAPTEPSP